MSTPANPANPATSAVPLPPVRQGAQSPRFYPRPDPSVSKQVNDALRRIFDLGYTVTDSLTPLVVAALGNSLVTVPADPTPPLNVPGCQLTLARAGIWIVMGTFTFLVNDAADIGSVFTGSLYASGLGQPATQIISPPAMPLGFARLQVQAQPSIATVAQTWIVTAKAGAIVRLRCQKDVAGTGASQCDGGNSSIAAMWGTTGGNT